MYGEKRNHAYLTMGTSKDPSEFVCDRLTYWWDTELNHPYPHADKIILRCDGGGSHSSRYPIVKQDFQPVSTRLGLPIQIQHDPPSCSKYHRIEHRMFPQLTRQWKGVIFRNADLLKDLAEQTTTKTGRTVKAVINTNSYHTGRKADPEFLDTMNIEYDRE